MHTGAVGLPDILADQFRYGAQMRAWRERKIVFVIRREALVVPCLCKAAAVRGDSASGEKQEDNERFHELKIHKSPTDWQGF